MAVETEPCRKTKSGRIVKKPIENYQQKLFMNSQACSKYKAKKKTKEKVPKHRIEVKKTKDTGKKDGKK